MIQAKKEKEMRRKALIIKGFLDENEDTESNATDDDERMYYRALYDHYMEELKSKKRPD